MPKTREWPKGLKARDEKSQDTTDMTFIFPIYIDKEIEACLRTEMFKKIPGLPYSLTEAYIRPIYKEPKDPIPLPSSPLYNTGIPTAMSKVQEEKGN